MNMAFDGDIVAVELLPQEQWHEEKSLALADGGYTKTQLGSLFGRRSLMLRGRQLY
uniref:Uncharacterized protein n=1 Tax=Solanum tuberosum TaxID=4113 RepID=M1B5Y9_SOLTU